MAARAAKLKYTGHWIERKDAEGNVVVSGPSESFPGIPAKDLTEADIRELTDEQYSNAIKSGLYVAPAASKSASNAGSGKKAAAKKPAAKPVPTEAASAEQAKQVAEANAGGRDADGSGAES